MKKFREEFRAFINKGNVLGLAVGVIIGGAFATITSSLTNDVIMPIVSMFLGGISFESWKIALPNFWGTAGEAANYLNLGTFINAVLNFFILALVVFFIVRAFNRASERLKKQEEETPAAPNAPSAEESLLTEIRDLLKDKQ